MGLSRVPLAFEDQRKFFVFIVVFVSVVVLLLFDKISDEVFKEITIAVVGLYMAGNVGEHFARRKQYEAEIHNPPGWGET